MELNGQPRTRLIGPNGSFEVFSGTGDSINDPEATDEAGSGPLPTGDYYIVDRPQGGFFGRIFSRLTGRDQWFALYRQDGAVDDVTTVNGVQRSLFRLHAGTIERGISPSEIGEVIRKATPFAYRHEGLIKTGYYDPATKIFIGEVAGRATTVFRTGQKYIENLMKTFP